MGQTEGGLAQREPTRRLTKSPGGARQVAMRHTIGCVASVCGHNEVWDQSGSCRAHRTLAEVWQRRLGLCCAGLHCQCQLSLGGLGWPCRVHECRARGARTTCSDQASAENHRVPGRQENRQRRIIR